MAHHGYLQLLTDPSLDPSHHHPYPTPLPYLSQYQSYLVFDAHHCWNPALMTDLVLSPVIHADSGFVIEWTAAMLLQYLVVDFLADLPSLMILFVVYAPLEEEEVVLANLGFVMHHLSAYLH